MSLDPISKMTEDVFAEVEVERQKFASGARQATEPNQDAETIQGADILRALHRNQDGDADLFIRLHQGRISLFPKNKKPRVMPMTKGSKRKGFNR